MARFTIFAAFWVWLTLHPVFAERGAADEANRIGLDGECCYAPTLKTFKLKGKCTSR